MTLRVIDQATVRRLLTYEACIPLMREAMTALSAGHTKQTLRQIIDLGGGRAFGVMPGAGGDTFGAKLISVFHENFAKGIQSHQGAVLLFDPDDGALAAVIHAGEITAIRTAAATAAASDVLARPDATCLAILGYGEQGAGARPRDGSGAPGERDPAVGPIGRACGRAGQAAGERTATARARLRRRARGGGGRRPDLHGHPPPTIRCWKAPGWRTARMSTWWAPAATARARSTTPLVARGRLFADHREGVLRQGAEVRHAIAAGLIGEAHVLGEIGEVMSGAKAGRQAPGDVTIYKSLGAIVQDLYAGWFVLGRAAEMGLGAEASF